MKYNSWPSSTWVTDLWSDLKKRRALLATIIGRLDNTSRDFRGLVSAVMRSIN